MADTRNNSLVAPSFELEQSRQLLAEAKLLLNKADFDNQSFSPRIIDNAIRSISNLRSKSVACVDEAKTKVDSDKASIKKLQGSNDKSDAKSNKESGEKGDSKADSPPPPAEEEELGSSLQPRLKQMKAALKQREERWLDCELFRRDADELIDQLADLRQKELISTLTTRNKGLFEIVLQAKNVDLHQYFSPYVLVVAKMLGWYKQHAWSVSLVAPLAALLGFLLGRFALTRVGLIQSHQSFFIQFLNRLLKNCAKNMTFFVLFLACWVLSFLYLENPPPVIIQLLVQNALFALCGLVVIRSLLTLDQAQDGTHYTGLAVKVVSRLRRSLTFLIIWSFVGACVLDIEAQGVSKGQDFDSLLSMVVQLLIMGSLLEVVFNLRRSHWLAKPAQVFALLTLISLVFVSAAIFAGYLQLGVYVIRGCLGTLMALGGFWLIKLMLRDLLNGLESPQQPWHHRMRGKLKLRSDESVPGLFWLRFLLHASIVFGLGLLLLRAWGFSSTGFVLIQSYLVDGFAIGSFQFVPARIFFGLLLFAALLSGSKGLAKQITQDALLQSRLEPSARETVLKLITYIGFCIAVILGLSTAGFDFQNLAIVAGALSVGIGFGLQNIVNNFVSGIILLFERPVRKGDWVVVGGTEGIIKNIRVRATELQTWDRSDVVIPNSEFISHQVTNFTLRDQYGRVICPVGVAYGSDTALVKRLLEGVAHDNSEVLKNYPQVPDPIVLFKEFGDSSLNFELRFFIRDVTQRLGVASTINFAIDQVFRENNIVIPFPQRDVHMIPRAKPADDTINPY